MPRSLTAVLLSLAAFLFFTIRCIVDFGFNPMVGAVISAIVLICSGVCLAFAVKKRPMPPHLLFAIADVLTAVGLTIVSIWCMATNSGGFTDMIGGIMLLLGMPVLVIAFAVNMVVWKKQDKENT